MVVCIAGNYEDDYAGYVRILSTSDFVTWTLVRDIELKGGCNKAVFSPTDHQLVAAFDSCMATYPIACKYQDPSRVVGGFDSDSVLLWHPTQGGGMVRRLNAEGGLVYDFAFSGDGRQLVVITERQDVVFFDVNSGNVVRRWNVGGGDARKLHPPIAFSPSGNNLLVMEQFSWHDKTCELWGVSLVDARTGQRLNRYLYPRNQMARASSGAFAVKSNNVIGSDKWKVLMGNSEGFGVMFDVVGGGGGGF
jgi:hypothetical protein